jgi:hypothetical protein
VNSAVAWYTVVSHCCSLNALWPGTVATVGHSIDTVGLLPCLYAVSAHRICQMWRVTRPMALRPLPHGLVSRMCPWEVSIRQRGCHQGCHSTWARRPR